MTERTTLYERAGGTPFFEALVGRFVRRCRDRPDPAADLSRKTDLIGARHRLTLFLIQYWGGPTTYDQERGHPRLRLRHAPFAVGPAERDRWLELMDAAVVATAPPADVAAELDAYFAMAAEAMRNRG